MRAAAAAAAGPGLLAGTVEAAEWWMVALQHRQWAPVQRAVWGKLGMENTIKNQKYAVCRLQYFTSRATDKPLMQRHASTSFGSYNKKRCLLSV